MTYKVNGTAITTQPTTGRWLPRKQVGIDGNGHTVFVGVREVEMKWQAIDPATYNQLVGFFTSVSNTGTAVVDLPQFGLSTYTFYSYTGCVLNEPEIGNYFSQNHLDAFLLITNIVTT